MDEGRERQEVSKSLRAGKKNPYPAEALDNLGSLSAIMAIVGS